MKKWIVLVVFSFAIITAMIKLGLIETQVDHGRTSDLRKPVMIPTIGSL